MDDAATHSMDSPDTAASSETTALTDRRATGVQPALLAGRHAPSILLFLAVTFGVLAADLALKHLSFEAVAGTPIVLNADNRGYMVIPNHPAVTVIPHLLSLRLTTNTGVIFGLAKGGRWVFVVVSLIAVVFITRIFWRSPAWAKGFHLALALILAGALGNLYDRVKFGAVRDMLHLFPGMMLPFGWSWPGGARALYPWIFNLADAALVLGVIGVLAITWLRERHRPALQSDHD